MVNQLNLETKQNSINEIKGIIDNSSMIFLTEYRGLSANDITDFRREVRNVGAQATVYKNKLVERALNESNIESSEGLLKGPNLLVSCETDSSVVAKFLVKFSKEHEVFSLKGGFLDRVCVGEDVVIELSKLPSKDELIGKFVMLTNSPITKLVRQLSTPMQKLVYVLDAIKTNKSGGEE